MIDLALAQHEHFRRGGQLVSTGLVALLDLVDFPGIIGLIAPDALAVAVERTVKSHLLRRRQMLLLREYQDFEAMQRVAQFVDAIAGIRTIEIAYGRAERRVFERLNNHGCPW